jgi:stress response protein YsnF
MYSADEIAAARQRFNVVKEKLEVGKREVQTGACVSIRVGPRTPVSESVNLREQRATIERRAALRPATRSKRHTSPFKSS